MSSFLIVVVVLLVQNGCEVTADNPESDAPLSSYEVVMSWGQLDFQFDSPEERQAKINSKEFIPQNNIFSGIKINGKRIFLTIPRWREGIPATLAYVNDPSTTTPTNPTQQQTNSPLLIPYPNWEAQALGDCNALQYVHTVEVDQFNRLWIVDTSFHRATPTVPKCPPKLVIMDLTTDKILLTYTFPAAVVSPNENLLSDLVVGCPDLSLPEECWAYITDSLGAKLVVFHLRNKQSWAVRHSSMSANGAAENITILGHSYSFNTNINGLALSPFDQGFDQVYYTPLSSKELYSITTKTLKAAGSGGYYQEVTDGDVKLIGQKFSQSDGMAMDSSKLLFYGLLSSNGISYWNSSNELLNSRDAVLLVQNDIDLQWPDCFAFDNNGYLYVTTNRIQRAISNSYDFNDVNFRIVRIFIGTKSYQHSVTEPVTNPPVAAPPAGSDGAKYTTQSSDAGKGKTPTANEVVPTSGVIKLKPGPVICFFMASLLLSFAVFIN